MRSLSASRAILVVLLLLGASFTPTAAAKPKFTAASYPEAIFTEDTGAEDLFTIAGSEIVCSAEQFTGELKSATSEVLLTPDYVACKTKGAAFDNVTVTANGCKFLVTATTTGGNHGAGPVHIKCGPGEAIEIHHYSSLTNHENGISTCTTTIGGQTGLHNLTFSNPTVSTVLLAGAVTFEFTQLHGNCTFGLTINTTIQYHVSATVKTSGGSAIHVR